MTSANSTDVRLDEPVPVHPHTLEVLRWALTFSSYSGGCFDISVGAELVDWQFCLVHRVGCATREARGETLNCDQMAMSYFTAPCGSTWVELPKATQ